MNQQQQTPHSILGSARFSLGTFLRGLLHSRTSRIRINGSLAFQKYCFYIKICWLDGILYFALFINTFPNIQKYEQKQTLEQFNGSSKKKKYFPFPLRIWASRREPCSFPDTDRHLGNDQTHRQIDKSIYKKEPQPFLKDLNWRHQIYKNAWTHLFPPVDMTASYDLDLHCELNGNAPLVPGITSKCNCL